MIYEHLSEQLGMPVITVLCECACKSACAVLQMRYEQHSKKLGMPVTTVLRECTCKTVHASI
jgi:hypothetical protein